MTIFMEKLQTIRFDMHTRIKIVAIFFIIALVATVAGTVALRIDESEADRIADELNQQFTRFNDPRFIFGNNFAFTLIMFVPVVGPIWGALILFNTGTIISIISISEGFSPILTFMLLFLTPVFWLEFIVYSLAMAQSTILFLQMLRHKGRLEAGRTAMVTTICALILLLAAVVEWLMIDLTGGSALV